jgi:hypothetical protein
MIDSGTVGAKNLFFAKMTTEDTADTAPVYDLPRRIAPLVNISRKPTVQTAPAYADNLIVENFSGSPGDSKRKKLA